MSAETKVNSPTFEEWLCTPSSQQSGRVPLPWFSPEVRENDDSRIRWVDLDQVSQEEFTRAPSESEAPSIIDEPLNAEASTSSAEDQQNTGHYLDHIDAVQKRDEDKVKQQGRRGLKKSRRASQPQASGEVKPESPAEPRPTAENNPKRPSRNRNRRRRKGSAGSPSDV